MSAIIGLGQCGCSIAKKFENYPQYSAYYVDTDGAAGYKIETQDGPEQYEKKCPSFKQFFKNIEEDTICIFAGAGMISGVSLRMLETIKDGKIKIIFIKSDKQFLSGVGSLQEKATFGIMQEYARSAVFEKIF